MWIGLSAMENAGKRQHLLSISILMALVPAIISAWRGQTRSKTEKRFTRSPELEEGWGGVPCVSDGARVAVTQISASARAKTKGGGWPGGWPGTHFDLARRLISCAN